MFSKDFGLVLSVHTTQWIVDLDLATQGTEESIISTNAVFALQASLNIWAKLCSELSILNNTI